MGWWKNSEQKGQLFLIIGIILVLVIALVWMIFGVGNIFKFLTIIFLIGLGIVTAMACVWLFYFLFIQKHRFNVNYVNKKRLIDACTKQKRPELQSMYISGDKQHTRVCIGKITGYCRLRLVSRKYQYETKVGEDKKEYKIQKVELDADGKEKPVYELEGIEQDVFTVKPNGLFSFFGDPMVIRVDPEDHSALVGDVDLFGFSLIPISEYYFLNSDLLDVRKIEYAILKEAQQTSSMEVLTILQELVEKATGADSRHKKDIEGKALVETPEVGGNKP